MKNSVYILSLFAVLACGTWIFCNSRNAKTAEIRLLTQKKQAEANEARSQAMAAKEKKEAAELEKAAKEKELQAKNAAREEAELQLKKAEADKRTAIENTKKAEADAKTAEANREKALADAAAAKDLRLAAEAALQRAELTNETRYAELEIAKEARIKANLDLEAKRKVLAAEELKKADYETLLKNVQELEALLRQREEETRPDRTIKDLLEDNEVEPAEETLMPEEIAQQAAAESNRVAKLVQKIELETPADKLIKSAEERLARISDEGQKAVRDKARARLEALARRAAREGRTAVAEYYIIQAAELFGEVPNDQEQ